MSKQKTAVILMNLGGPDKLEDIKPFLINFFMDKNIIAAPWPIRWLVSRLIARKRASKTGEAGEGYAALGGGSPLLKNTQAQSDALQAILDADDTVEYKTFIHMRYWHPMSAEAVNQVKEWGADRLMFLPLYPQFSTATTKSSVEDFIAVMKKQKYNVPLSVLGCYPWDAGFIKASADNIMSKYNAMKNDVTPTRVLFSAHGLPEITVKRGDPYQWQCERTMEEIVKVMGVEDLDYQICYQSKVGPLKWIEPSTEQALERAAKDGVNVLVYPHAFVSDHIETLVELDEEYAEVAHDLGIKKYSRAETVMTHPAFIQGLADLVYKFGDKNGVRADNGAHYCPSKFTKCLCRQKLDDLVKRA